MEGHVLTAAAPALWNDEGNGNDAIYGLAMFYALDFGYHSPSKYDQDGSVEDGRLLVHACTYAVLLS
jgi:hypothetical protein